MPDARVTLVDGMRFVAESGSGHAIVMDAPPEHGGGGTGPRPMELLLMGLGGCTGMDAISILRKKKQDVTGLEIKVRGTRAEAHPMRYIGVTIVFTIRGRNLDDAAVKRAIELSMDKYCSVKFTLEEQTKVDFEYLIEQEGQ